MIAYTGMQDIESTFVPQFGNGNQWNNSGPPGNSGGGGGGGGGGGWNQPNPPNPPPGSFGPGFHRPPRQHQPTFPTSVPHYRPPPAPMMVQSRPGPPRGRPAADITGFRVTNSTTGETTTVVGFGLGGDDKPCWHGKNCWKFKNPSHSEHKEHCAEWSHK